MFQLRCFNCLKYWHRNSWHNKRPYVFLSGGISRGQQTYSRKSKVALDASFQVIQFRLPLKSSLLTQFLAVYIHVCYSDDWARYYLLHITLQKVPISAMDVLIIDNEQDKALTAKVFIIIILFFIFFPSFVWCNYLFLHHSSHCVDGDTQTAIYTSTYLILPFLPSLTQAFLLQQQRLQNKYITFCLRKPSAKTLAYHFLNKYCLCSYN